MWRTVGWPGCPAWMCEALSSRLLSACFFATGIKVFLDVTWNQNRMLMQHVLCVICVLLCVCFPPRPRFMLRRVSGTLGAYLKQGWAAPDLRTLSGACKHTRAHIILLGGPRMDTCLSHRNRQESCFTWSVWFWRRGLLMTVEACLALCSGLYIFNQRPSGYGLSCHPSRSPFFLSLLSAYFISEPVISSKLM